MAQRVRFDEPGAWLHVMNRGIARRTIAETRQDARYFFYHLARAARAGWFEIHAYSLLSTHFHLLVRSPHGDMWRGMRLFQNGYVRWFNRAHRRDGPLLRGRFHSKRIRSNIYWYTVVRYIDLNAPSARIVCKGANYPYSSVHYYLQTSGPPWMTRSAIEDVVCMNSNKTLYDPREYASTFCTPLSEAEVELIEGRLDSKVDGLDYLDDLITAVPSKVRSWMVRKARLADGTAPGLPIAIPRTIVQNVHEIAGGPSKWIIKRGSKEFDGGKLLLAGLLRSASGLTFEDIARYSKCAYSTAREMVQMHTMLLAGDTEYAKQAAKVLSNSMRSDWGASQSSWEAGPMPKTSSAE